MRRQNAMNNRGHNNASQNMKRQGSNGHFVQPQVYQQNMQQSAVGYTLEISKSLFNFLAQNNGIGKEKPIKRDGNLVLIGQQTSSQFENGISLALCIPRICQKLGVPMAPVRRYLSAMQTDSTPKARLTNWNAVLNVLKQSFQMGINSDTKALIIAGDQETIVQLYENFRRRCTQAGGQSRVQSMQGNDMMTSVGIAQGATAGNAAGHAAIIAKMLAKDNVTEQIETNPSISPSNAKSAMELVLVTMCQSLSIRPDQACALLSTNAHYLGHMFMKGINGSFDAMQNWCMQLLQHFQTMCILLRKDIVVLPMILHTLRIGMFTPNVQVATTIITLFAKLLGNLPAESAKASIWKWFIAGPGGVGVNTGLQALLAAMNAHCTSQDKVLPAIWLLIKVIVSGPSDEPISSRTKKNSRGLTAFLCQHLQAILPDSMIYMNTVTDILHGLFSLGEDMVQMAKKEGTARSLIEYSLLHADNKQLDEQQSMIKAAERNVDLRESRKRMAALELNVFLWIKFPEIFDEIPQASRLALSLLKKGITDKSVELQISSATLLFHLLDTFAKTKHHFAPYLYKSLIFALMGSSDNEVLHEYILCNMISTLDKFANIPVVVLIDPLIKQVAKAGYNNLLFDLFLVLSKHGRLDVDSGLKLSTLLGHIALNDPISGRLAAVPLLHIIKRYGNSKKVQDHIVTTIKNSLSILLNIEIVAIKQSKNVDVANRRALPLELMHKIFILGQNVFTSNTALLLDQMLDAAATKYADLTQGKHHEGIGVLVGMISTIILNSKDENDNEVNNSQKDVQIEDLVGSVSMNDMPETDLKDVAKKVFEIIDTNSDGYISKPEMLKAVQTNDEAIRLLKTNSRLRPLLHPKHWEETFDAMDPSSGNGDVDFDWFLEFAAGVHENATDLEDLNLDHTSESSEKDDVGTNELSETNDPPSDSAKNVEELLSFGKEIDDAINEVNLKVKSPMKKKKLSDKKSMPSSTTSVIPSSPIQALTASKLNQNRRKVEKSTPEPRTPSPGPAYAFRTPPGGKRRNRHRTQGAFMSMAEWQGSMAQSEKRRQKSRTYNRDRSRSRAKSPEALTHDFAGLEGSPEENLKAALKMFQKWDTQMKHAYDAYAQSRANKDSDAITFDHMKVGRSFLKFKHWMVLLRDYKITPGYINPKELRLIWNKVCAGELQTIDYNHFLLAMRVVVLAHDETKYGEDDIFRGKYASLNGRPESRGVDGLLSHMTNAAVERYSTWHSRIWSAKFKDDLAQPVGCDPVIWSPKKCSPEKLKSLNGILRKNSKADLPTGVLREHVNVRVVPEYYNKFKNRDGEMDESTSIVLEILNDLMLWQFEISLLGEETKQIIRVNNRMKDPNEVIKKGRHSISLGSEYVFTGEMDKIERGVHERAKKHPKVREPSSRLYNPSPKMNSGDPIPAGTAKIKKETESSSKFVSFGSTAQKKKLKASKAALIAKNPVPEYCNRLYPYGAKPANDVNGSSKIESKNADGSVSSPDKKILNRRLAPLKKVETRKKEEEERIKAKMAKHKAVLKKRQQDLRKKLAEHANAKLQQEQEALAKKEAQEKRREQRKSEEKDMRIKEKRRIMKWKEKKYRKLAEERANKLQEEMERREESNDAILIKAERARRKAARQKQRRDQAKAEEEELKKEKMEARARLRNEMADSARRRVAERKVMIENMADIDDEFEAEYE